VRPRSRSLISRTLIPDDPASSCCDNLTDRRRARSSAPNSAPSSPMPGLTRLTSRQVTPPGARPCRHARGSAGYACSVPTGRKNSTGQTAGKTACCSPLPSVTFSLTVSENSPRGQSGPLQQGARGTLAPDATERHVDEESPAKGAVAEVSKLRILGHRRNR
jgi:hypothetical protein